MSVSKKLRELNRARIEHDKSRLMAGFAESRKEMVNMVDAALASKVEELTQQLADSQKREVMLRHALNMWLVSPQGERNVAMHEAECVKSTLEALAATDNHDRS